MGTRCNVVINYGQTKINLYRHWDGYYAETGYDLAMRLFHSFNGAGNTSAERFFDNVYNAQREPNIHDKPGKRQYELTTEKHGDIEYYYSFIFSPVYCDSVRVLFSSRSLVTIKGEIKERWKIDYETNVTKETIGDLIDFMRDKKLAMQERARKVAI
tara:strand:+ start:322 stop:792 length:471 start_codon:yes stop_codon:yes gene_type:complete